MPVTSAAWHLVRRPHGELVDDDFALVEHELADPGPGEVLVRNTWLSVDPYMRGRMNDAKSYVAPFALDEPMDGGAVGVVEQVGPDVEGLAVGRHRAARAGLARARRPAGAGAPSGWTSTWPRRRPTSACWACRA